MNKLKTVTEIAEIFKVSNQTVSNWIKKGCPAIPVTNGIRQKMMLDEKKS